MSAGRRMVGAALSLVLLAVMSAQDQPDVAGDEVIHVNVQLVQTDVQVLQRKTGRAMDDLDVGDFHLYEDGVEQKIVELSRDQLPLSVVLLFDLTESVQPVLKTLGAGALAALRHLKPEDEVAVMVYAASAHVVQDFTTDREKTVAAIETASTMQSGEEAYFNEAIFQASAHLSGSKNSKSRRSIIWLTDNVPNTPNDKVHSEKDAIQEVFETGTVVSALVERSAFSDVATAAYSRNPFFALSRMHHPPGDVNTFAASSGGAVMSAGKNDISGKLAQLIDEIRTRYTLGYYPSTKRAKGTFCTINVEVSPEVRKREGALVVRVRKGYYR
jgi:VWFA-related protein